MFLFVVALGLSGGCNKKSDRRQKNALHLNIGRDPRTLDPRQGGDNHSYFLIRFLFEGLMSLDPLGKPTCALAKQVDISDDHCTYTFHLRDAKWSNGSAITAHDFVYSWTSALRPECKSDFTYELYPIVGAKEASFGEGPIEDIGVKAIDDKTLVVNLKHPSPYFLESVTHAMFLPICAANEKKSPQWMGGEEGEFVTSGPFTLDTWKHQDELVFKKNRHYWANENIHLERIVCYMVDNPIAQLDMFKSGEIDWVGDPCFGLPKELMHEIRNEPGLTFCDVLGVTLTNFNTGRFPTNNVKVRRALSLAIDRAAIAETISQSDEVPWTSVLPPSLALQTEPYFPIHDPALAKRLLDEGLQELGTSRKELRPIELTFAGDTGKTRIAEILQQHWEKNLGIKIKLANTDWKVFFDNITHGQYDISIWSWTSGLNDPIYNLEVYKEKNNSLNVPGWENPDFVRALDLSERTFDSTKRMRILHEAEKILLSEMPIAPIIDCKDHFICSKRLKGVVVSKMGLVDMSRAYLEDEQ